MADCGIPNFDQCLQILKRTPALLRGVLEISSPGQLSWRPSDTRWSIAMVIAHLADVEWRGFRDRFEPMLREQRPLLRAYDQLALFRDRTDFDPHEEMTRFEERRAGTLELLRGMPEGTGERTGRHEELGLITIAQLTNEFAFHDLGHVRQVFELYRSHVFYPEMGVYQGYYRINP